MKRIMLTAVLAAISVAAQASIFPIVVSVTADENGNGFYTLNGAGHTALTYYNGTDGGNNGALTYFFQTSMRWNEGDLVLLDAQGHASDLLRFRSQVNWGGKTYDTVSFYSLPGGDLADTPWPSYDFAQARKVVENEHGPTSYTPGSLDPGYLTDGVFISTTFKFTSVPEATTWLSGVLMLSTFGFGYRRLRPALR